MQYKELIKFYWGYIKDHKKKIIIGAILIFINSILILPGPFLTRYLIDKTIPHKNLDELLLLGGIFLLVLMITRYITYKHSIIFTKLNNTVILNMKKDLYNKVQNLPMNVINQYDDGYLMSRVSEDADRLRSIFVDTYISILRDVLTLIVGIIAMFYIDRSLSIITCLILPLYIFSAIYFTGIIKKISADYYENRSLETEQLHEGIKIIELSKLYFHYTYSLKKYYNRLKSSYKKYIKMQSFTFLNGMLTGGITSAAPIIILIYGGYEIISGGLSLGNLIAFNSILAYIFGPTSRFVQLNINIQSSLVALDRVYEIIKMEGEEKSSKYINRGKIESIRFEGVGFSYHENGKDTIHDISFSVSRGEKIGVVGLSGSGKTTILKLITALYKINKGKIFVNNTQVTNDELLELRKQIALVEQEPILLNDTIYNNILFGNPGALEKDVVEAAKSANADIFINKLEEGYNTHIFKQGLNLSVGQKQRIAIARALIKKPAILLLDEITSNVDTISEKYIIDTLDSLSENMIMLIVSHRFNVVKDCDRIVLLNNGTISEIGNHQELLLNNVLYKKLYNDTSIVSDIKKYS